MAPLRLVYVIFFVVLANFCGYSNSTRCGSDLQHTILTKILNGYDKRVRPPPGEDATLVTGNTAILNVVSVDEKIHQWRAELYFRQTWNDPRLMYTHMLGGCSKLKYITLADKDDIDGIWKVNLFFPSEITSRVHDVMERNIVVRIYPNGDIFYSIHIDLTLFCTGQGSKPGEYMCPMELYPYGPQMDEVLLKWDAPDPIQIDRTQILLDDHTVGKIDTGVTLTKSATGVYSTLVANFHFLRKACLA